MHIVLQELRQGRHPHMPGGKGIVRMGDDAQKRKQGCSDVTILAGKESTLRSRGQSGTTKRVDYSKNAGI